jgi:hypothetical protein
MFTNCSSLAYIAFPNAINDLPNTRSGFSRGVATNGTFVKKTGTNWGNGITGIPSGWTVIEV